MGSSIQTGVNWSIADGTVNIFGAKGANLSRGTWAVNALGDMMCEVSPATISSDLIDVIEEDRRAGNADKIAYIGVGPRQAVVLFLEGVLTRAALDESEETTGSITAEITLSGTVRKLVIKPDLPYRFGTFDANDELV
jgi:hypothetical protein